MAISYKDIRGECTWRATTGLGSDKFHKLVGRFKTTYEDFFGKSIQERHEVK